MPDFLTRTARRLCALVCVASLLAACGGGSSGDADSSPTTVTQADGGAQVTMVRLGAAAAQPTLTIARDATGAPPLPEGLVALTPVWQFGPVDLAAPGIRLRVPFKATEGSRARLLWSAGGDDWSEVVDAVFETDAVVAAVTRLGHVVVVGEAPADSALGRARVLSVAAPAAAVAPIAFTVDPSSSPMPTLASNVYVVKKDTNLVLRANYSLPAGCPVKPKLVVTEFFFPRNGSQGPTAPLVETEVSASTGSMTTTRRLAGNVDGYWVFGLAAHCTPPGGASLYSYSVALPVVDVQIAGGPAPQIYGAPASLSVAQGNPATFSVIVAGTSLSYQWQRSGDGGVSYTNVTGATASAYTLARTTTADNGSFWRVVVKSATGQTTSAAARLTVIQTVGAPAITSDPADQTVIEGLTASFTVRGTGSPAPAFQWQRRTVAQADPNAGWTDIAGATAGTYTTPVTTLAASGAQFRAVLRNSAGSATSLPATLRVTPRLVAPAIVTAPKPLTVVAGQAGLFSVAASGSTPLSYQWFKEGVAIAAANASQVLVSALSADVGRTFQIQVEVGNAAGKVRSQPVTMTVTSVDGDLGTTAVIPASSGGEIRPSSGVVLLVDPGALIADTAITVRSVSAAELTLPSDFALLGKAVSVTPSNVQFLTPAIVSIPLPEDLVLPEGMALAVIDMDTAAAAAAAPRANLLRMAVAGVGSVRPDQAIAAAAGSHTCLSPGSQVNGAVLLKWFKGQVKALGTVPASSCTLPSPAAPDFGIPSSTSEGCANESDHVDPDLQRDLALVNRHVQCTRATGSTDVDYLDPKTQSLTTSVGDVTLEVFMAVHGKASGLGKDVTFTVKYKSHVSRPGYSFPAPRLKLRIGFSCDTSGGLDCNAVSPVFDLSSPGSKSSTQRVRVNFTPTSTPFSAGSVKITTRVLFTTDGKTPPANEAGGLTDLLSLQLLPHSLRCDKDLAKAGTSGCVFDRAAAVFALLPTDSQVQSRAHIRDALAGIGKGLTDVGGVLENVPGGFGLEAGTRAIADPARGVSLSRTRNVTRINDNRTASTQRCVAVFGPSPTPTTCPLITDPDAPIVGCDCDEYPFASTVDGAANASPFQSSVRRISSSDNRSAGSKLGNMFARDRVFGEEEANRWSTGAERFWVAVP